MQERWILLENYESPGRGFRLEFASLAFESIEFPANQDVARTAGYASLIAAGILRRRAVLTGIFATDDRLWFLLGKKLFDLTDGCVVLRKTSPWPFIRRVAVLSGCVEQVVFDYRIRLADERYWPTRGDIFTYVIEIIETPETRYRFIRAWAMSQEGRLLSDPEVHRELEDEIERFRTKLRG